MRIKIIILFSLLVFTTYISYTQSQPVTVSGIIKDKTHKGGLSFVSIVLKKEKDSAFVTGTVSNEEGRFTLTNVAPGSHLVQFSYSGYASITQPVLIGSLSPFLDLGAIELQQEPKQLQEVVVTTTQENAGDKMDKKSFSVAANISQSGGSQISNRASMAK